MNGRKRKGKKTHVKRFGPVFGGDLGLGVGEAQEDTAGVAVRGADFLVVQRVGIVQGDEVAGEDGGVVDGGEAEAAAGGERLLLLVLLLVRRGCACCFCARGSRVEVVLVDVVESNGFGKGAVDDGDDVVVVFGEVVEEHGVGGAAIVVGHAGGLERHGAEEGFLVGQADQAQALLDRAGDARPVGVDVAEQSGKLARFQHEFAQGFMAEAGLGFAHASREVGIKTDQRQIVHGGFHVGRSEVACVVAEHAAETDLRELLRTVGYCRRLIRFAPYMQRTDCSQLTQLIPRNHIVGHAQQSIKIEGDCKVCGGDV